ncbi:MAG: ParB/RepB/Spo0J family partition protein, partial [Rickettsiales bacterium]|nr:ParB/RepB/Spo0J family partition protein [Rickettsiales bacterium]
MQQKKGLGRGLADLKAEMGNLGQSAVLSGVERVVVKPIPVSQIAANHNQPRTVFDEEALLDLASSVKERGVLQPILIRPVFGEEHLYEIVAGERRWRAAQLAGLTEIPALIKPMTEENSAEVALIENIQREDLSPIEEATGYRNLISKFQYSVQDLVRLMGKSESYLRNIQRLLDLPKDVQELVNSGKLSASQARAIIMSDNPGRMAQKAVDEKLNVRALEDMMRQDGARKKSGNTSRTSAFDLQAAKEIESKVSRMTGLKTRASVKAGGAGSLTIFFTNLMQRQQLIEILKIATNNVDEK